MLSQMARQETNAKYKDTDKLKIKGYNKFIEHFIQQQQITYSSQAHTEHSPR